MATLAFGDHAKGELTRLACNSPKTALRLINRLQSWAQNTPPLPSGSICLDMSIALQYQRQCTVDGRNFTVVFVYPHGIRKRFMIVGVYSANQVEEATSVEENGDIYDLDN